MTWRRFPIPTLDQKEMEKEKDMINVPYNISDQNIALYFGGKMHQVPANDSRYDNLKELLREGNYTEEELTRVLDVPSHLEHVTHGAVTVVDGEVTFNDMAIHGAIADILLTLVEEGFDIKPWANFLENLMENPSYSSRKQLYGFLEKYKAPITEDGCFIAFKGVREDYTDYHTGTFNNMVGSVVEMDRFAVDDDPNRTCSSGLHVCAAEYLDGGMFNGGRIMVVKVNPRDVVSIPTDYEFSKMRLCKYEVVAETEMSQLENQWASPVYS